MLGTFEIAEKLFGVGWSGVDMSWVLNGWILNSWILNGWLLTVLVRFCASKVLDVFRTSVEATQ
jgi:hypothetical protein